MRNTQQLMALQGEGLHHNSGLALGTWDPLGALLRISASQRESNELIPPNYFAISRVKVEGVILVVLFYCAHGTFIHDT